MGAKKIGGDRTTYSKNRKSTFSQHHFDALVSAAVFGDAEAMCEYIMTLKAYATQLEPVPPTVGAAPEMWPAAGAAGGNGEGQAGSEAGRARFGGCV